jgi:hypothetical protein
MDRRSINGMGTRITARIENGLKESNTDRHRKIMPK